MSTDPLSVFEEPRPAPPGDDTTADTAHVHAPVTGIDGSVKVSRAGRNLPAAIGVGLLLGALIVLSLFWRKELFLGLATVSVAVGAWELTQAMRRSGVRVPVPPALIGCVAMMVGAYVGGTETLAVIFALACVLTLMWRGSAGVDGRAAADVTGGFLVAAYPSLLAGFAMLLLAAPDGAWRVFTFLAVTVASDVGGYAVGVLAGRHPMAPTVSPKKSWEGFAGSVLGSMIVGALCLTLTPLHGPAVVGAVLGAVVAAAATLGDLAESSIKRDLGIKDMSDILPGHGGLMDRLDSLLVTAPTTWAVLTLLLPPAG
ncbi:MAG TPA: phosphatidate cytidylyltransferase [Dermatophilaceae bacterium]|nr:phosphatidate cytidylyltransferase [Dermatophilaceae bacterium]